MIAAARGSPLAATALMPASVSVKSSSVKRGDRLLERSRRFAAGAGERHGQSQQHEGEAHP